MRRPTVVLLLVTALGAAAACERPSERVDADRRFAGRVLRGALTYPQSTVVAIATGDEAAEVTLTTRAPVAAVAAWFRDALRLNGWEIERDVRERDGTLVLYAERERRPLWIRLRENAGGPGTTYSLIGAEVVGDTIR